MPARTPSPSVFLKKAKVITPCLSLLEGSQMTPHLSLCLTGRLAVLSAAPRQTGQAELESDETTWSRGRGRVASAGSAPPEKAGPSGPRQRLLGAGAGSLAFACLVCVCSPAGLVSCLDTWPGPL